jgi:4-amino-4-deoxy-L-arabinose transferase-like glycosyltransferase
MRQTRRNDPCPCGSGKKYKKCCMHASGTNVLRDKIFVKKNYVYLALISVFFLSIFLRYYGFHQPHGLTFDEGLYSELLAGQLKEGPANYSTQTAYQALTARGERLPKYLDRPLFKHPPLYCYLIALNYKLFSVSNLAAVSVSILFGSLMVLAVFFLGKALYDDRAGLLAAFFLCIDPVHWVCSERIWMETTMSFFILMAILLFVLGQTRKYFLPFSGISIGLAMLTKYPGVLPLFIIVSFVVLMERSLLKQKGFGMLCFLPFLVFSPWVIWNWKVYGNLHDAVISAHALKTHWESAARILSGHKVHLSALLLLAGVVLIMRHKIRLLFGTEPAFRMTPKRTKALGGICFSMFALSLVTVPFLRSMVKEAFVWKDAVLVGWSNPFSTAPWYFYLMGCFWKK